MLEVKAIPHFVTNLVLNDRKNILHVHNSVVQTEVLPQSRVGLRPRLLNALLVLLLLGFRHLLDFLMVNSLLCLNVLLFLLLCLQRLKIPCDLLHLLDGVTFTSQQEPLVLHTLTRFYICWNLIP